MMVIIVMTFCYASFYIIPTFNHRIAEQDFYNFTQFSINCTFNDISITNNQLCQDYRAVICQVNSTEINHSFAVYLAVGDDNEVYPCLKNGNNTFLFDDSLSISCVDDESMEPDCLYKTGTFMSFVVLMCIGTIGFNVTNCISDAICFDMLG